MKLITVPVLLLLLVNWTSLTTLASSNSSHNSVSVSDHISCRGAACLSLADGGFRVNLRDDLLPGATLVGNVSSKLMNVYASRYNGDVYGSLRLSVRLLESPVLRSWSGPVVVTARNNAGGYSFSLSPEQASVSRILCPSDAHTEAAFITVGVGANTKSSSVYQYEMRLDMLNTSLWMIPAENSRHSMRTSWNHPDVLRFFWTTSNSILVRISSEENECASIIVQPNHCPLAQALGDLVPGSRQMSIIRDGAVRISIEDFPDGFFVIALSHQDSSTCWDSENAISVSSSQMKNVQIEIISDDQGFSPLIFPFVLVFVFILLGISNKYFRAKPSPADAVCSQNGSEGCINGHCLQVFSMDNIDLRDPSVDNNGQISSPNSLFHRSAILFSCGLLVLSFGASTVVRHVYEEQHEGNLDLCYRNERCSYSALGVPDFNHVSSNIPYVGAGIGFLISVHDYRCWYFELTKGGALRVGVRHDFDLLAAMGIGLFLEGFTSGLYHICPNNLNSNIDFFFIYYIYALIGVKLFQTRRGIVERFNYTPVLLVAVLTTVSFSKELFGNRLLYRLVIGSLHIGVASFWSIQMYLFGDVSLSKLRVCFRQRTSETLKINRKFAVAVFLVNIVIVILGLSVPSLFEDFSSYALLFFTSHSGLYILVYFIMKKVNSEKPTFYAKIYLIISLILSVSGLIFFVLLRPYDTNLTPALSRSLNSDCYLMGFYDAHDIWHFLSAGGLYFTFMVIMTLDDDLLVVPTDRIRVI